ncbi:hypothetical protein AAMO2058_000389100 [Amorphochlora amoebiformis]
MGKFSKDKRDIYYRKAKEEGYRARSAFKLKHIHESFGILKGVTRVVDLCAAPGGWSEVLSRYILGESNANSPEIVGESKGNSAKIVGESKANLAKIVGESKPNSAKIVGESKANSAKIIAVDLLQMAPIPGVITLIGDITREATAKAIIENLGDKKAQLVVCDGAPDVIGMHDIDEYIQHQLVLSAVKITTNVLEPGGVFVAKVFRGKEVGRLMELLNRFFKDICMSKPKACRNSSMEGFVVCQGFNPPPTYIPSMSHRLHLQQGEVGILEKFKFRACGPHTWDSDQSYPLSKSTPRKDAKVHVKDNPKKETGVGFLRPAAMAKVKKNQNPKNKKRKFKNSANSDTEGVKADQTTGYRGPSAPPINPPYKAALDLRRGNRISRGNMKKADKT